MQKPRLVAMLAVYNGEQFLRETLNGFFKKIKDLEAIHIQDGMWIDSGFTETNSTDSTEKIIDQFIQDHQDIQVFYEKAERPWKNPSEKRNHQLQRIAEEFEKPYHVFWFDDDEEIRFRDGKEMIWLRESLQGVMVPVLTDTYGYNSREGMSTIRFIPGGFGYHFHTEDAMCIHDSACRTIANWTPRAEKFITQALLQFNDFFIINKWNLRNKETMERRGQYNLIEIENRKKMLPCLMKGI